MSLRCRVVTSDQRARPSDFSVWKRRCGPSSSWPTPSTNSRLLGLRPSVAICELGRLPKQGTGALHGITPMRVRALSSSRFTRSESTVSRRSPSEEQGAVGLAACVNVAERSPSFGSRLGASPIGDLPLVFNVWIVDGHRHLPFESRDFVRFTVFKTAIDLKEAHQILPILIEA